ncbi:hypothetical protein IQ270_30145, partial [Microcoleus sp. LEGE 07076]|uniref:hypothetical protein n=1 Tax=Microcoleus sp. LEGE 07076 TaxID=915322 RepID=UPI00188060B5
MKVNTMIQFEPRNQQAMNLLGRAISLLDGRKKFDEADLKSVLSFIFSNRHKPYINLTGFPGIVEELVLRGILKRHSGLRNFTLSPEFVDEEAHLQTVREDIHFKHPVGNKSKAFFRNAEECISLEWDDVASIGYGEAHLLKLVDK